MTEIRVRTLDGNNVTLAQSDIDVLAAATRGKIIVEGEDGYDASRTIWNGMVDRRPGFVVRCIGAADVVACVNFARQRGLELCIRGGGHNISGLAVADGAMMLDMTHMKGVNVDVENRIAHCQAGCTLGDVDRDTQLHGLAAVLGFVSNTGITGLTLGGGFGYLTRRYGWTVDNVRSFEIVTADGAVRRVSESSEPDLFWGLCGGGGNFGVVTQIEYDLHPVGPEIYGGAIAWKFEDAADVLEMYRKVNAAAPPEQMLVGAVRPAPPAPWLPKEVHGQLIAMIFVCDTGPIDEAEERAAALKSFGNPVGDVLMRRPYTSQQSLLDATQPDGRRYYWKSEYMPGVEQGFIDEVIRQGAKIRSPHSAMLIFPLHGALSNLPEDHSAVGNRKTGAVFNLAGAWDNPTEDDVHIGWAREAHEALAAYSTGGTYINFLNEEEGDDRIQDAYGENYARLVDIKTKYDPDNFFRNNKNITPKA